MLFLSFCFVILLNCTIFAIEMKITKKRYLEGFLVVTVVLALVRCIFPSVANDKMPANKSNDIVTAERKVERPKSDSTQVANRIKSEPVPIDVHHDGSPYSRFFNADGSVAQTKIMSVSSYSKTFPDMQDVQHVAAKQWGVKPVLNRDDAERRKSELVYVGSNPYFHIDKLNNSIPYLVPRASNLLHDIGRNFYDSLQMKGVPLHQVIVTSALRTKDDVAKLRNRNFNATENSCHLYGTTFDVCYNRYKTVEAPGENRWKVRNDTLKYILAEVLRDMRESGRCYIKYEVKQGCFHITVR